MAISSQIASGLLEPSRSRSVRRDLVFLVAQVEGYHLTPRSPQKEKSAKPICAPGPGFPGSPGRGLSPDTKIAPKGEERGELAPFPAKSPQAF
ncbi:hypothetical protein DdX_09143 [Ditylenchus destructor]|uniref:Uncharacterized protein n=1 Tax=Ditylenchus destructor TaxID=166010 RepID=A0AAD4N2S9_9BILA|nr:hypothetical protein DdX_09143 [Ditylenchus destructor]